MNELEIQANRKKWPKLVLTVGLIVAGIILVSTIAVRRIYLSNLQPVDKQEVTQHISIPLGSSVSEISAILKSKGMIKSSWAFNWYVRSREVRESLQAGTYAISPSMGIPKIVNMMLTGQIAKDVVTIFPGQNISQIKDNFVKKYGFNAKDVEFAFDPVQYANHPALLDKPPAMGLEGYLYPETFLKTDSTKPQEIIRLSLDEMAKKLTVDRRRAYAAEGLTVHQAVTLASIIEHEVSKQENRNTVAQVFLLRLKQGKPLESDITVKYGASYDTYKIPGLPPGPVSNVTESTLEAVAYPSKTDWLYFVAGDDGVTYFSHTFEEHQKQTRDHCHDLCSQP